jgi:hypothetical protein
MSSKRKPLQVPQTIHDVGELVDHFEFVGCTPKKDPVICRDGNDEEMFGGTSCTMQWTGRSILLHICPH